MKKELPIEKHGILESTSDFNLKRAAIYRRIKQYIQAGNLTKDEYFKLMTGQYGHGNVPNDIRQRVIETLQNLPDTDPQKQYLNDVKLNDKAIDFLSNHYITHDSGKKENALYSRNDLLNDSAIKISKEKALDLLSHHKKYINEDYDDYDSLARNIIDKYPEDRDINQAAILNGDSVFLPYNFKVEHLEPHIIDHMIATDNLNNNHNFDHVADSPHLSHEQAKKLVEAKMGSRDLGRAGKILDKINPEERKNFYDKVLGIKGGFYHEDPSKHDPKEFDEDVNWMNWHPRGLYEKHVNDLPKLLESAKGMDDSHIEHIIRHGRPEQKYALFHNSHLKPEQYQKMYNLWKENDKRGWDPDDVGNHLKMQDQEDGPSDEDRYEAERQVAENYPVSDYINDYYRDENNNRDMERLIGSSKGDFIDNHLNQQSWTAKNPNYTEGSQEPQFINYEDKKPEHPEYNKKLEQAQQAWDKAYEHAKANPNDEVHEHYNDVISQDDSVYDIANDIRDHRIDNWFGHKDMMPAHAENNIPEYTNDLFESRKKESERAREDAAIENSGEKKHLDAQVPVRSKEHAYANNLHHYEMVKDHADANGGSIDIGHMNKLYPNQKELWKKIFDGKGKISSQEIEQKIHELPKTNYAVSHGVWDKNLQNINNRPQTIFRLDHSPESEQEIMKDPEVHKVFKKIQDASQRSGHPTNLNTIGWARVDTTDPKKWMVDELQSDFSSQVRRALEEHGNKQDAEHLKHIEAAHKNWREALLNHVVNTAKKNGVELLYTHSPESKASHTGAENVHTVYKDSYQKIPRQMGFKEADVSDMPLNENGARPFKTAMSNENLEDRINKHKEAMQFHANLAGAHKHLLDKKYVNYRIGNGKIKDFDYDYTDYNREHRALFEHHKELAQKHHNVIENMDPLHEAVKIPVVADMDKQLDTAPDKAIASLWQARNGAKDNASDSNILPMHHSDEVLAEKPEEQAIEPTGYKGHVLDLRPQKIKKSLMVADLLIKAEMSNNDKVAVAQALMNIQSQQEKIEALKEQNPDAYQTIGELTQVLVDLFKELNHEPIEAAMHEIQASQEMEQPQQESAPQKSIVPPQNKKVTNRKQIYPTGSIRQYDNQNIREKTPDGRWIGIKSGDKKEEFQ